MPTTANPDLLAHFKEAPRAGMVRFAEVYLMLAKAGYRPEAPGDGLGGVSLTDEELDDDGRLLDEAVRYGKRLWEQEDGRNIPIGISNYRTNRVFALAIEAARLSCGGAPDALISKVLELALAEIKSQRKN